VRCPAIQWFSWCRPEEESGEEEICSCRANPTMRGVTFIYERRLVFALEGRVSSVDRAEWDGIERKRERAGHKR
jgi:hypothetical protein